MASQERQYNRPEKRRRNRPTRSEDMRARERFPEYDSSFNPGSERMSESRGGSERMSQEERQSEFRRRAHGGRPYASPYYSPDISRPAYGSHSYGQQSVESRRGSQWDEEDRYNQLGFNERNYSSNQQEGHASAEDQSFYGIGPKGYERSDDRIKEDVCDALADHPGIDASNIEVEVSKGDVTLSGHVRSRHIKRLAEDAIEGIRGVKDISNQIRLLSKGDEQSIGAGEFSSRAPSGMKQKNEPLQH